jgi:hypothetical protein
MNNIFQPGANLLRDVGSRASTALATSSGSRWTDILLYLLAAIFVVVALLMITGKSIDTSAFAALDPRPRTMIVRSKGSNYWEPSKQYTNLIAADSPIGLSNSEYSLVVECVLYNTRNYTNVDDPFRHILHRGSNEL